MCDDAYSRQEIMAKERDMIETVDYDVGYPLSYRFLRRFGRVSLNHMFISSVLFKAHYVIAIYINDSIFFYWMTYRYVKLQCLY